MREFPGKAGLKVKRFIVDAILNNLIPPKLQPYMVFWARMVLRVRKPLIIGVTGSVGKTTTTTMIGSVLSHRDAERVVGPVGYTLENMNDDLGVAATVLRFDHAFVLPWGYIGRVAWYCLITWRALRLMLGHYPKVMVVEYGMGWSGNIRRQVAVAAPAVAVVTAIGPAHLEKTKTVEGVVREKCELVRAVPPSGLVVLGEGHDYVSQLEQMAQAPVVKVGGKGVELSQNITRAVCRHLGVPDGVVDSGLRDFKGPKRRLNRLEFDGMTVIDDSYNANPLSMNHGLDILFKTAKPEQRRLAILGAMGELGEEAPRYHEQVGAYARRQADVVVGVGELARHYKPDVWFETSDACVEQIESLVRFGDCLLVKGSASVQMERVVNKLREIAGRRQGLPPQALGG